MTKAKVDILHFGKGLNQERGKIQENRKNGELSNVFLSYLPLFSHIVTLPPLHFLLLE
jgi:hypothetical protein